MIPEWIRSNLPACGMDNAMDMIMDIYVGLTR
jgi:hypothetical protein